MRNTVIKSYMPRVSVAANADIVVALGEILVSVGDVVDVLEVKTRVRHRDEYVIGVEVSAILDLKDDVLNAYECKDFSEFRRKFSENVGVALPAESVVTLVLIGSPEFNPYEAQEEQEYLEEDEGYVDQDSLEDWLP